MDWVGDVVAAADSGWAITAIFLIGLYVLLWKYGGELIRALRANTEMTKKAAEVTEGVAESIVTNHGSKNLGDAIDRLTEWVAQHMIDSDRIDAGVARTLLQQRELKKALDKHIAEYRKDREDDAAAIAVAKKLAALHEGKDEDAE